MMAGVDMLHVPYRGGAPALNDVLSGQVKVMFGTVAALIEQIRAGKLRPLAVTTATRWEGLPDHWDVREGSLTGYTSRENPLKSNTFLVWKDGAETEKPLKLEHAGVAALARPTCAQPGLPAPRGRQWHP